MAVSLLLAVSALTFGAMNLLGDPLFNILGPIAGDTDNPKSVKLIEQAKEQYHLDRALGVRGLPVEDDPHELEQREPGAEEAPLVEGLGDLDRKSVV